MASKGAGCSQEAGTEGWEARRLGEGGPQAKAEQLLTQTERSPCYQRSAQVSRQTGSAQCWSLRFWHESAGAQPEALGRTRTIPVFFSKVVLTAATSNSTLPKSMTLFVSSHLLCHQAGHCRPQTVRSPGNSEQEGQGEQDMAGNRYSDEQMDGQHHPAKSL